MNAVNLQTIVESLDREKTILVFSKQNQTFHTFGKGEKLNSNIYESKKDQVEWKIHEFITDNRYYLNTENLNKLQLNLEIRVKHLEEKIYGINDNIFQRLMKSVKKCINVFISIFPFTSKPSNEIKEREEKRRLEQIILAIKSEGFANIFIPDEPALSQIPASVDLTSQLQTPASAEDITLQPIVKPIVNLTSDLPVEASQPPIPPPPVFQPPKIILLVDEPSPLTDIKPTVYKSLTPDLLRDQINRIDLYIEAFNLALHPYKGYFEELNEMKEAIILMQEDLKSSQNALVECETKLNYLKEKCNENKIATFNIQGRTVLPPFQMYPMEIYKEIAGRINPHASFPAIDDFYDADSMNMSSADDLNLSPVNPSFHHHSSFSSDNSSNMRDSFELLEAASSVKETFKNIMCDDLPKNNKPSLQKDIELSISEIHLKRLEKFCKAIEIEVQERKLAITELEVASKEMEENSFDVYDQTNGTSLVVNYTVKQMETLLVEKYNHLNAWLRHKNSRVQELDKKEKNQPAKSLPQQVSNEIPDDLVKQYPEILNTLKMPQHIAIQLTKIKNANRSEDEERGPTEQYIYSIYKQLIPES